MKRVILIHWNAEEGKERAERLRSTGYDAECHAPQGAAGLRIFRESPPDAFVIDLDRLPSQGGAVAIELRRYKATRFAPIVFAAGDPAKVTRVRKLLPDALFTEWSRIADALRQAITRPVSNPMIPGGMDGYAGTPLPKKLGIRPDSVVMPLGAPEGFERKLGILPENVRLRMRVRRSADLVLLFSKSRADLKRRFPAAVRALAERGGLWIIWPKRDSGVGIDLTQTTVRAFGLAAGLVDYKICAVDETWSGLLFTRRRK